MSERPHFPRSVKKASAVLAVSVAVAGAGLWEKELYWKRYDCNRVTEGSLPPFPYEEIETTKSNDDWVDGNGRRRKRRDLDQLLAAHALWVESEHRYGRQLNLTGADLQGQRLDGANLQGSILSRAVVTGANLRGANLAEADLRSITASWGTDLAKADLAGAQLSDADLIGAYAPRSEFIGALMQRARLSSAVLANANLDDADLTDADLGPYISPYTGDDAVGTDLSGSGLSGTKLINVNLAKANLSNAYLSETDLTDSNLFVANLHCAVFEPRNLPDVRRLASAGSIETLTYSDHPDALIQLRNEFRQRGYRRNGQDVTYALRRAEAMDAGIACWGQNFDAVRCAAYVFDRVLFDLTCQYGRAPGRIWAWLILTWALATVIYHQRFRRGLDSGLILLVADPRAIRTRILRVRFTQNQQIADDSMRKRASREWRALRVAGWFSLLTATSLGFRDLEISRWLRLMSRREYELRAVGRLRTIAGIQTLISLSLIALWILLLVGHPFD